MGIHKIMKNKYRYQHIIYTVYMCKLEYALINTLTKVLQVQETIFLH